MGFHGTESNFINHEMLKWGEDYVFDLLERGYTPVLTDNGWRWVAPTSVVSDGGGRQTAITTLV